MTYLLRNIPDALWVQIKRRASTEGHQLRFILMKLLEWYAAHGLPK